MNLSGSCYVRVAAVEGEVIEGAGLVEVARRAHALADNGARPEAIGEMMFGYMAPTSKWYRIGVSRRFGAGWTASR